jgi:hypothetical protein
LLSRHTTLSDHEKEERGELALDICLVALATVRSTL